MEAAAKIYAIIERGDPAGKAARKRIKRAVEELEVKTPSGPLH
jgi:hypothetical protein